MLAVAGLTFAYTSCTDYSKDIDENKNQIDAVSSELATAKQQIESMKTDISNLQTAKTEAEKAISALQTSLKDLQTKHDADVKALKAEYAAADEAVKADIQKKIDALQKAHETEVSEIKTTIENLQKSVTDLEKKVGSIEETIKTLATKQELSDAKTWAQVTFVTKDTMKVVNATLGALQARLEAAEKKAAALEEKHTSDVKDLTDKIAAAKKAADDAKAHSVEVLGKVEALKTALGVYADSGVLAAKIEALTAKDTELADSLSKKLNIRDFGAEFDKAIEKALKADGKVGKEIADQIKTAKDALEAQIKDLQTYVDTKFNALFSVAKQLKSLVFVPELYVDGIEATEYTYADYTKQAVKEGKATKVVDDKQVPSTILYVAANQSKWWNYGNATGNDAKQYINIAHEVTYKMNPSSAEVPERLAFVSYDKQVITKASEAIPDGAQFVSAANGDLKVAMNPVGHKVAGRGKASIFALQATYKTEGGADTTVTSDFANLYASKLTFDAVAFSKVAYKGKALTCATTSLYDHLYQTAAAAIQHAPSVVVRYNDAEGLNLRDIVTTHITIDSKSAKAAAHVDYAAKFPKNDYGIDYKFELIDYTSGDNTTSESQHAFLKDGRIFVPCSPKEGLASTDEDAIGEGAVYAVGRRPLVRVTVQKGDNIILVGFIKFEIVKNTGYNKTEQFTDWKVNFGCEDQKDSTTWSQMVDNVVKLDKYTKEEFCLMYELQKNANGDAIQYVFDGTNFEVANATDVRGVVTEKTDAVPGTTTDVLKWTLDTKSMSLIYQGAANHSAHVWVRYVYKGTTPTSIYEGIYVRLDVTVLKPAATVGVKLDEYWFKNQENAKINVRTPHAVSDPYDPNNATFKWITDTKQVWEGNAPKFTAKAGETYAKYDPAKYEVKYYFAPVQPKVGNYQLYAASAANVKLADRANKIIDKYDTKKNYDVKIDDATGVITTKEAELAAKSDAGIYENTYLLCEVGGQVNVIANINPTTGAVGYWHSKLGETLLNLTKSDPANQYEDSKLYANIGMVYYAKECQLVMPVDGEINPYYFLRPINIDPVKGKHFRDAEDYHKEESNLDVFDLLSFSDWRGEKFVKAADDYSNIWYFAYYNIKKVKVDIDNVTTNMNESDPAKFVNLATKTKDIMLSHCFGNHTQVKATGLNVVSGWYENATGTDYLYLSSSNAAANVDVDTHFAPCEPLVWGETEYNTLVGKFGFIRYHTNKSTVSKAFKLRIPIAIGYDWGTITTTVEVDVLPKP